MHHHKPCPHCGSHRAWSWNRAEQVHLVRCPRCHCAWNLQGDLLRFGKRCPLQGKVR